MAVERIRRFMERTFSSLRIRKIQSCSFAGEGQRGGGGCESPQWHVTFAGSAEGGGARESPRPPRRLRSRGWVGPGSAGLGGGGGGAKAALRKRAPATGESPVTSIARGPRARCRARAGISLREGLEVRARRRPDCLGSGTVVALGSPTPPTSSEWLRRAMEGTDLVGKIVSTWLTLVLSLILLPSAFGVSLGISEIYMKILVKTLEWATIRIEKGAPKESVLKNSASVGESSFSL
uniref:Uncharacterized protein LOC109683301 n=1 Tax=Castor canadensis TaxID=51338 RepID=A0A8B7U607_CASCN|nr:uncharacterized protein LOC109683301 [Castor canadensis]